MPREHRLKPVTSGLAFDVAALGETPPERPSIGQHGAAASSFVTSHSARVLLAGAGFLADAVIILISYHMHKIISFGCYSTTCL